MPTVRIARIFIRRRRDRTDYDIRNALNTKACSRHSVTADAAHRKDCFFPVRRRSLLSVACGEGTDAATTDKEVIVSFGSANRSDFFL